MGKLRDAAVAAEKTRRTARAAEEAARTQADITAALASLSKSQLATWFPGVEWEFVGIAGDGAILAREKGGDPVVLGAWIITKSTTPKVPDVWGVAIYTQAFLSGIFTPKEYVRDRVLNEPADLGEYLIRTEPKVVEQ